MPLTIKGKQQRKGIVSTYFLRTVPNPSFPVLLPHFHLHRKFCPGPRTQTASLAWVYTRIIFMRQDPSSHFRGEKALLNLKHRAVGELPKGVLKEKLFPRVS